MRKKIGFLYLGVTTIYIGCLFYFVDPVTTAIFFYEIEYSGLIKILLVYSSGIPALYFYIRGLRYLYRVYRVPKTQVSEAGSETGKFSNLVEAHRLKTKAIRLFLSNFIVLPIAALYVLLLLLFCTSFLCGVGEYFLAVGGGSIYLVVTICVSLYRGHKVMRLKKNVPEKTRIQFTSQLPKDSYRIPRVEMVLFGIFCLWMGFFVVHFGIIKHQTEARRTAERERKEYLEDLPLNSTLGEFNTSDFPWKALSKEEEYNKAFFDSKTEIPEYHFKYWELLNAFEQCSDNVTVLVRTDDSTDVRDGILVYIDNKLVHKTIMRDSGLKGDSLEDVMRISNSRTLYICNESYDEEHFDTVLWVRSSGEITMDMRTIGGPSYNPKSEIDKNVELQKQYIKEKQKILLEQN